MGKGKRSREAGTKRRTILQIDSNKVSRSSNVSPPAPAPKREQPPAPDPLADEVAEFLKEISALEQESINTGDTQAPSGSDTCVLPEGWKQVLDPESGYTYFWNVATNDTSWEAPALPTPAAGLSLISAYSESDSDNSPVGSNAQPAGHKEGVENREFTESLQILPRTVMPATSLQNDEIENPKNTMDNVTSNTIVQQTDPQVYQPDNRPEFESSYSETHNTNTYRYEPPPIHASTQTEETPAMPTEDALRPLINQLSSEVRHKLDFLGVDQQQLNRLQAMLIELETRLHDWTAGYLPSEYALTRVQECTRVLREYEQSAAPAGWGCSWDPAQQKYQYVQVSSGRTTWEYPTATATCLEVLEDDDMVLSEGESDGYPPLPPLPPSPTSGPPPPPSDVTKPAVPAPPLPGPTPHSIPLEPSNPPLPDQPPSDASILPPLPPSGSPAPPPCPDVPTPPLPPSELSSNMSHSPASSRSPSTKPSSPYPSEETFQPPLTASMQQPSESQYYTQPEQQQYVYAYYTPAAANSESHNQAAYLQQQYPPVADPPKSPQSSGRLRSKRPNPGGSKNAPSSLSTHAVSLKKRGVASMLDKWQQMRSADVSSSESSSEGEQETSLKDKIALWKREQITTGKAVENANFQNIHGNWRDKVKRAKKTSAVASSLLNL